MFFSLSILYFVLLSCERKQSIILSFIYGITIFTSGVSWVFFSVYYYGGGSLIIALLITMILVIFLSLIITPLGLVINKNYKDQSFVTLLIIPSIWVLLEIFRSIIFGGFPWLIAGYSQEGTIFNVIYPITGSYSVSFVICTISLIIALLLREKLSTSNIKNVFIMTICFTFLYFYSPTWSIDKEDFMKVSILQPNINIGTKYDDEKISLIKQKYINLISENSINKTIILPETAIPLIYERDKSFYQSMRSSEDINIISGVFHKNTDKNKIYNSIVVLNEDEQIYDKRHLVPFGEYTPIKIIFDYLSKKLNIPMSNLSHGDLKQKAFVVDNIIMHPLICYEIAYPQLINMGNDYSLIINVSNDAWFGDTFAPHQHLQIARLRALEAAHPVIRAANTGISAIINKNGLAVKNISLNTEGIINGEVYPSKGISPYMRFGDYPILMLIFSIMLVYCRSYRKYD
ncbi:MAG: apolipoprotein N-acyltransferase [Gammaproteobacteria bacterium]|nr:apolipoprotein N-acyltransferase [Gammaproteobacteria bacterium]